MKYPADMGRYFRLEQRDNGWRVEFLDGTERAASAEEIALWLTGTAFREMQDEIEKLRSDLRATAGNKRRETQLKREANARVRILREALDDGLRLAYAVPGAFPETNDDDYIPDADVGVSLRRNREAARGMTIALARTGKRGMPK